MYILKRNLYFYVVKAEYMSTIEMKSEITEQLNSLTETELNYVLDLINTIKAKSETNYKDIDSLFEKVANKYGAVLQKLAQ
jgi:hypothetical protein